MAKSGIALLLGGPKGPKGEGEDDEMGPESGEDDGGDDDAHGTAAAAKFAAALKAGDHAGMWDAFKTMHHLCEGYEDEDEDEDEGDEAEEK